MIMKKNLKKKERVLDRSTSALQPSRVRTLSTCYNISGQVPTQPFPNSAVCVINTALSVSPTKIPNLLQCVFTKPDN